MLMSSDHRRNIWNVIKKKSTTLSCTLNVILIFLVIRYYQSSGPEYPNFPPEKISPSRTSSDWPRVLCMVLTSPENYERKAVHLAATWGSHCSSLVFISDKKKRTNRPEELRIEELPAVAGRKHLWDKVKAGIMATYNKYQDEFDYLLKADDDTFIVMDNLRHLLSHQQVEEEFVLGHLQRDRGVSYPSGGSGYVISKPALHRIVREGLDPQRKYLCRLPHPVGREVSVYPNEDLQMGKCASILGIKLVSSVLDGETTFFPFKIEQHLIKGLRVAWWLNRTLECQDCVSSKLVSVHYVQPHMMYVLEYFTNQFTRHSS